MKLTQLNERSKTTTMKTAFGDDIMVSYSEGKFWYNGEDLGSTISSAKTKLADITNNSNFSRELKNSQEKSDEATVKKSIDRHYKKLNKQPGEEFDFVKFMNMNEGLDDQRAELDGATLAKIYRATDNNDHNEARILLAKAIAKLKGEDSELVDKYQAIITKHNRIGHMPQDLLAERSSLDKKLFGAAKYWFANYEEIKKAY